MYGQAGLIWMRHLEMGSSIIVNQDTQERTCRNDRVTRGMDFFPAIGKYKGGAGPRHEQGALSHSLTAEFSGLRLHCRCCEHENENNRKTAQKDFL